MVLVDLWVRFDTAAALLMEIFGFPPQRSGVVYAGPTSRHALVEHRPLSVEQSTIHQQ